MAASSPKLMIGCVERVDLVDWNISGLAARVDTGAQSSALHVQAMRDLGNGYVRFDVRLHRTRRDDTMPVIAPVTRSGLVRSSTGRTERRIFVPCLVRIGPIEAQTEVSLVDRQNMTYRMLVGRSAIAGRFLVDAKRRYLLGRQGG